MAQTYTTQWVRVSNGEITTHNPEDLVDGDIKINSAEVQWEGVDAEVEETVTKADSNTSTYQFSGGTGRVAVIYATHPSVDGDVQNFTANANTFNVGFDGSGTMTLGTPWGEQGSDSIDGGFISLGFGGTGYQGSQSSLTIDVDQPFDGGQVDITAETTYEKTTTVTKSTAGPRVTRDVLGESGGITLSDGEQSSWYNLSDLDPNSEEFYHDIDGSGEARFRFRFDWETKYPDAVKQLRVGSRDGTTIHKVSLADPADSQLAYNHVRTRVDGSVYAVDVVDPSNPDAIPWLRIGTPQGVVCPRAYETVSY